MDKHYHYRHRVYTIAIGFRGWFRFRNIYHGRLLCIH